MKPLPQHQLNIQSAPSSNSLPELNVILNRSSKRAGVVWLVLMLLLGPFALMQFAGCEASDENVEANATSSNSASIHSAHQHPNSVHLNSSESDQTQADLNLELNLTSHSLEGEQEQDDRPVKGQQDPQPPAQPSLMQRAGDLLGNAKKSGTDSAKKAGDWVKQRIDGVSGSTTDAMKWANGTFQSLKERGLTTADSTSQWLVDDWNNMESWEYKIITSESLDNAALEKQLNELGAQGWECFDVTGSRLMFKKQRESYLRRLPFKDLLKLAPLVNQGGD